MHELQQLDRELDVAQAAAAELEFALAQFGGHELLDAPAHRLHLGHERIPLGRRPHHRTECLDVAATEIEVAGHRPGLEQRLELPGLGPALVVRDVRVQGADQFAAFALGTQRGVDLEERRGADPHHLPGDAAGAGIGRLGDEHDVDVADIVELAGPALAHRDHGQVDGAGTVRDDVGDGHRQGRRQGRIGEIREPLAHLEVRQDRFVLHDGGEIGGREQRQLIAVAGAQSRHRGRTGDLRPVDQTVLARPGLGLGVDTAEHPLGEGSPVGQVQRPGEITPPLRVGDDVVAEGGRASEQAEQPPAQSLVGAQRGDEFRPAIPRARRAGGPGSAARGPRRVRARAPTAVRCSRCRSSRAAGARPARSERAGRAARRSVSPSAPPAVSPWWRRSGAGHCRPSGHGPHLFVVVNRPVRGDSPGRPRPARGYKPRY